MTILRLTQGGPMLIDGRIRAFASPLVDSRSLPSCDAEKVLAKLFAERGELVRRTVGTRVGTNAPTDLFNLLSEHLKIAREGGSYTLQRRLLSAVMGEVVSGAAATLRSPVLRTWQGRCVGGPLHSPPHLWSHPQVFYAQNVLADLMDWWNRDPESVDMDYVTAVINDAGESPAVGGAVWACA
jgi:hypothetical protein